MLKDLKKGSVGGPHWEAAVGVAVCVGRVAAASLVLIFARVAMLRNVVCTFEYSAGHRNGAGAALAVLQMAYFVGLCGAMCYIDAYDSYHTDFYGHGLCAAGIRDLLAANIIDRAGVPWANMNFRECVEWDASADDAHRGARGSAVR